jgi:hypothetical protein
MLDFEARIIIKLFEFQTETISNSFCKYSPLGPCMKVTRVIAAYET